LTFEASNQNWKKDSYIINDVGFPSCSMEIQLRHKICCCLQKKVVNDVVLKLSSIQTSLDLKKVVTSTPSLHATTNK
jgi:hypothetical protein